MDADLKMALIGASAAAFLLLFGLVLQWAGA